MVVKRPPSYYKGDRGGSPKNEGELNFRRQAVPSQTGGESMSVITNVIDKVKQLDPGEHDLVGPHEGGDGLLYRA